MQIRLKLWSCKRNEEQTEDRQTHTHTHKTFFGFICIRTSKVRRRSGSTFNKHQTGSDVIATGARVLGLVAERRGQYRQRVDASAVRHLVTMTTVVTWQVLVVLEPINGRHVLRGLAGQRHPLSDYNVRVDQTAYEPNFWQYNALNTIRYDTIRYIYVRSKADGTCQLNLGHGTNNEKNNEETRK